MPSFFLRTIDAFINERKRNGGFLERQRNVDKLVHGTATVRNSSIRIRCWRGSFINFDLRMLTIDVPL